MITAKDARQNALRLTLVMLTMLIVIWSVLPLFMTITTSIKIQRDAFSVPPKLFAFTPTFAHYTAVFARTNLLQHYMNSVVVTVIAVVLSLSIGVPAAYSLTRFRFRGRRAFTFFLFLTRVFPPIALLLPVFMIWTRVGLMDTRFGLTLMYVQVNLSLVVWMLTAFFTDLPLELEDAAMIDGCSRLGAFTRVLLPLAAPGLAATAILVMVFSWNEFMFAFALTGRNARTAPVTIYNFIEFEEIQWGQLQAAGFLVTLPVLLFTLLVERHLAKGLTSGSLK